MATRKEVFAPQDTIVDLPQLVIKTVEKLMMAEGLVSDINDGFFARLVRVWRNGFYFVTLQKN